MIDKQIGYDNNLYCIEMSKITYFKENLLMKNLHSFILLKHD